MICVDLFLIVCGLIVFVFVLGYCCFDYKLYVMFNSNVLIVLVCCMLLLARCAFVYLVCYKVLVFTWLVVVFVTSSLHLLLVWVLRLLLLTLCVLGYCVLAVIVLIDCCKFVCVCQLLIVFG